MPLNLLCFFQLEPTTLENRSEGQFVGSVEKWVQLYNVGLANGKFPDPRSWVELRAALHNEKHRAEMIQKFQVRPVSCG